MSSTADSSATRRAKPNAADLEAAARLRTLWEAAQKSALAAGRRLTQAAVCEELDINQSAVSQYLNGLIPLNYRAVLGFAKVIGCDPRQIRDDLPEQRQAAMQESHQEPGWDDVVGYVQPVGLGASAEAQEYAETHKLKFRADSLRRQGLRADRLAVYYGQGDSMEPRIRNGDAILFDTSDTTRLVDGAIYLVERSGEINVKRCEIIDDLVYFRSDNPAGDHTWRKPRRMDHPTDPITVLGRVRWIGSWEG